MQLLVCWLLYPLVLLAVCTGCGLVVNACAGWQLDGRLVPPTGLALIAVLAQFATWHDATAEFAVPLVVGAAVAGFAVGWRRIRPPDGWLVAAAVGAYLAFGAPVLVSGDVTWAGFLRLDDTSTWWALTDRVMAHGHSIAGLEPSSYRETLRNYFDTAYPLGAFLPLGVSRALVGQDLAWIYQPYMSAVGAMITLALQPLLEPLVRARPARALACFVASQGALLYGYLMWGGIKEITAAMLLVLVAALMVPLWDPSSRLRAAIPVSVASAALVAGFSATAGAWLAPAAVVAAGAAIWSGRRAGALRLALGKLGLAGVVLVVASVPAIALARDFEVAGSSLTAGPEELGNLIGPLRLRQLLGIWPALDFRTDTPHMTTTNVLLAVVAVAAVVGLAMSLKRSAGALLTYVGFVLVATVVAIRVGSPWVDAKTMAIAAPAPLALAMGGALALARPLPAVVVSAVGAIVITGGVLWSNALAYQGVALAPNERMAELEEIGHRFSGASPSLVTEYLPYANRFFLRRLDAEGATDLRWRPAYLADGRQPPNKVSLEIDDFRLDQVLVYKTLVLRSMPNSSRPPSAYRRAWQGRYYDVWSRQEGPRLLEHMALGANGVATAVPECATLERIGRRAERLGGRLVAARRAAGGVVGLSPPASSRWAQAGEGQVRPLSPGTTSAAVDVRRAGRYDVWVGGSFARGVEVSIEGRRIGRVRDERQDEGQYLSVGQAELRGGRRRLTLTHPERSYRPGEGDQTLAAGPVVLTPSGSSSLQTVRARGARTLCGQSLDWVEIVDARTAS